MTVQHLPEAVDAPCKECPWRRDSAPGWLGPHSAEEWVRAAHADGGIACHATLRGKGSGWQPGVKQCRGAAMYRANVGKLPRDPEVVTGPADRELVFASATEFTNHHKGDSDD